MLQARPVGACSRRLHPCLIRKSHLSADGAPTWFWGRSYPEPAGKNAHVEGALSDGATKLLCFGRCW